MAFILGFKILNLLYCKMCPRERKILQQIVNDLLSKNLIRPNHLPHLQNIQHKMGFIFGFKILNLSY